MKTIVAHEDKIKLQVHTTGDEVKEFLLPVMNVHYWYPFNINFSYMYTNSKGYLYLVKERDYTGENLYKVEILKKTKPLEDRNGIMFHPNVYQRNKYIIEKAKSLGLPVITGAYDIHDVNTGFKQLSSLIKLIKGRIEDRYMENDDDAWYSPEIPTDEWDQAAYKHATEDELTYLQEFGEMYTMLTLMRKIAEGR
ncbi:hypothetical protein P59_115 [Bacillus phage P59]|nr:hypothetical protein P59_115 [Bacillus phage P59]